MEKHRKSIGAKPAFDAWATPAGIARSYQYAILILLSLLLATCTGRDFDPQALEQEVLRLSNLERVGFGLVPLQPDPRLSDLARRHSRNMALQNFYAHQDPFGYMVADRQKEYYPELIHLGMGENIHKIRSILYDTEAQQLVNDWMDSPGHRANILNTDYTHLGIGVHRADGYILATQVFSNSMLRVTVLPQTRVKVGSSPTLDFEYLSPQPSRQLKCALKTPDPNEQIFVSENRYYNGFKPLPIVWTDGTRFRVKLDFSHGRGKYTFDAGWDKGYYPALLTFEAY